MEENKVTLRTNSPFLSGAANLADIFVEEGGDLVVYASAFVDMVKSMHLSSSENVSFHTDEFGILSLDCGNMSYRIGTISSTLFPMREEKQPHNSVIVKCEDFRSMIRHVSDASSKEFPCVKLEIANNTMKAIATDSNRMIIDSVDIDSDIEENILVRADAISMIGSMANGSDGKMSFSWNDYQVICEFDDVSLRTSMVNTSFPEWRNIFAIKESYIKTCRLSATNFRRLCLVAITFGVVMNVSFKRDKIIISTKSDKYGEGKWEMEASLEGAQIDVKLSNRIMHALTSNLNGGELNILMKTNKLPLFITHTENPNLHALVMPLDPNV